ncbi:MAG: ATP-dependent RNA helicase HrpA [Fibrobacter sp.]|jgi:HrpA-like RNA helicase|nr:ATP-dependent RNA helicase HrpA [Fibrobacter sp.]
MASYAFDSSALKIEYPELPVVQKRELFLEQLQKNQVIVVQADTGSGKSTQLPKFLLESGIAVHGRIGVTQPRRLAALSIADRLREELKQDDLVKTRIRFLEEGSADAPIKVMTDGILLQEFRRDRFFRGYSAIMIDEAHERSLNIDILLGIFKMVLEVRPEFKLIIASATLDADLFKNFYPNSVVIEAEGRTFPVEIEYREASADTEKSAKGESGLLDEAKNAILDLMRRRRDHLLCFLPTERDIQDLQAELKSELDERFFEVFPLFGRMSPADQRKVFHFSSKTKIVLSTNIAETSLTIPGIAYVVDTGLARISRYNSQSRIQALPIEKISQASARQRAGRAGRVKPGVCIRLYGKESFEDRPEFTEPEIRRSNLANVVLQLQSLELSVEKFPFLQPPLRSAFRGAYKTLHELGAISGSDNTAGVTELGKSMAALPMDVQLSAVLLRAREYHVLQAAIVICAALSIQDPRLYPPEEPEKTKAREMHRKLGGHKSDFLVFLALWNELCKEWGGESLNKLRKVCDKRWLHFLRCREWFDLYEQFCRILKVDFKDKACPFSSFHRDHLHTVLLSGFLGGIAHFDKENLHYKMIGGQTAYIFPGSDLFKKTPEWIFSAEIRETNRVYLTQNAEIRSEWILRVAEPFCTRRWFNPAWNASRGFVEASEEIAFRNMVISRGKRVDYARVNPEESARIFFREAVALGDMVKPFPFMEHNRRVIETLRNMEVKLRRWGISPSEDEQTEFYLSVAPEVCSLQTLRAFIEKNTDNVLKFSEDFWLQRIPEISEHHEKFKNTPAFPARNKRTQPAETEAARGGRLEIFKIAGENITGELVFDASKKWDGLTLKIPAAMVSKLTPAFLARFLPQWRAWMMEAFIRELPPKLQAKAASWKEFWDDRFYDLLEARPGEPPFLLLAESFSATSLALETIPLIHPEKDFHLNLHLNVFKIGVSGTIPAEVSPFDGTFRFFSVLRPAAHTFSVTLAVGDFRYGFRLGENALMSEAEALFWEKFQERLSASQNTVPEISELLQNRLSFLETLFSVEYPFEKTPREWAALSLNSSGETFSAHELSQKLPKISGLEFSRGRKMTSFRDLRNPSSEPEDRIFAGLVYLTWESALLGISALMKAWQMLKTCSGFIQTKKRFLPEWKALSEMIFRETSVYCRLCFISRFLFESANEIEEEVVLDSPKEIREKFRPYLQGRVQSESDISEIRRILAALEKAWKEDGDYFETWAAAGTLLETLAVKALPHQNEDKETVDADALRKLKMRFGGKG